MKNIKIVLSKISIGLITLGTIGFASIPYYDSKIDTINEHKDETLFNHNKVVEYMHRAVSDNTEVAITHDHIDILKKLNASKQLIEKKNEIVSKKYQSATSNAITAARMSGGFTNTQLSEIVKPTMDLSKLQEIHDSHLEKAYAGLIKSLNSMVSDKKKAEKLRKKKTFYWFISILSSSIGGILAIISSCLKENKNNTSLSSVTTPVKKGNQDGEGRDCRGLIC